MMINHYDKDIIGYNEGESEMGCLANHHYIPGYISFDLFWHNGM